MDERKRETLVCGTRWADVLFDILPFKTMKICPITSTVGLIKNLPDT